MNPAIGKTLFARRSIGFQRVDDLRPAQAQVLLAGFADIQVKNRLGGKFAILVLALSGALSIGAFAQTTEEGPGPSEQPSAPMEIGQVSVERLSHRKPSIRPVAGR